MPPGNLHRFVAGVILGSIAVLIVSLLTRIFFPGVFESFEAKTYDLRFRHKAGISVQERKGAQIDDIIIVDIDERSIQKLGRFSQWPRRYHAELINFLHSAGARIIGFDILFLEKSANSDDDALLTASVRNAGNVFFAIAFTEANPDAFLPPMKNPPSDLNTQKFTYKIDADIFPGSERLEGEFSELYNSARGIGFSNYYPDPDGVVRSMPLFVNFANAHYPSFALSMAQKLSGSDHIILTPVNTDRFDLEVTGDADALIPLDKSGRVLVNYEGPFKTFRYVSYSDVHAGRIPKEFFRDRAVLIGTSAAGLFDLRSVPVQNSFPGVEIHANVLHAIMKNDFMRTISPFSNLFIIILLSIAMSVTAMFSRMRYSLMLIIAMCIGVIYCAYYIFAYQHIWVELIRPLLSLFLSYFAVVTFRYAAEQKDKKRIKHMFQHYISSAVVDEILKKPDMLKLGGERITATAFFSDIKDFTTHAEKSSPDKLVSLLNEYLSEMTDIVLRYGGYLDKYEGDAIVAIWGVPVHQEDHARRACLAAFDMQKRMKILRKKWESNNEPQFEIRIGINSGPMIAGNIGGRERFDYTAIGDSVNLASRLEGVNKVYNTEIILSEDTYDLVRDFLRIRELDFIRVKGREQKVRIYELLGTKDENLSPELASCLEQFTAGLEQYRRGLWVEAFDFFQQARQFMPDDGPTNELLRRCKYFIENPDKDLKDGIFVMKNK